MSVLSRIKNIITTPFKRKEKEITIENIYYWSITGKSYHSSKDCVALARSKTICSGSLDKCEDRHICHLCGGDIPQ